MYITSTASPYLNSGQHPENALRACTPAAHGVQRGRTVVGGHQAVVQQRLQARVRQRGRRRVGRGCAGSKDERAPAPARHLWVAAHHFLREINNHVLAKKHRHIRLQHYIMRALQWVCVRMMLHLQLYCA